MDIDSYVVNTFGLMEGMNTTLRNESLLTHTSNGSEYEDRWEEGLGSRAVNHFHDPLKTFDEAGLNDIGFVGRSAALWGKEDSRNLWDREYFHHSFRLALTSSTPEVRLEMTGETFRTAGHILHLLQDMAVPAHVRNDLWPGHMLAPKASILFLTSPFEKHVSEQEGIVQAVSSSEVPSFDTFTDYFDTGSYRSLHTDSVAGPSYGLAEYTNSTFFSDFERFRADEMDPLEPYPNPNLDNVIYWDMRMDSSVNYPHLVFRLPPVFYSTYISSEGSRLDQQITHLARVGFFHRYGINTGISGAFFLDENCWNEYGRKLLPKAVGYSAGLLGFLFRGDVDFELDDSTGSLRIANNSGDGMSGTFELYYDDDEGLRRPLPDGTLELTIPAGGTVDVPGVFELPRDAGFERQVTLFFQGDIGLDEGVAGRTRKLNDLDFTHRQRIGYYEAVEPDESSTFSYDPDIDKGVRTYHCGTGFRDALSFDTVARATEFSLVVDSTPEIAKKLGFRHEEGDTYYLNTNTYNNPGLVEYFKVSTGPGKWRYVYDSGGSNMDEGWDGVTYPARYVEGLLRPSTGYLQWYEGLPSAGNYTDQCTLSSSGSPPSVSVTLYYLYDSDGGEYSPECGNDQAILAEARGMCSEYRSFYNTSLSLAGPYRSLLADSRWSDYGFEIRLNRLAVTYYSRGDGVIHDGPVTFRKDFASSNLIVH